MKKMKNLKISALVLVAILALTSCDNDDDKPVNGKEPITTVKAVYKPVGGGTAITLNSKDLDGSGANAPVVTVSGSFELNRTYNGVVTFKNEAANPVKDITTKIITEGKEYQLFYQKTGTLPFITYGTTTNNLDSNKKPIGFQNVLVTTTAAIGTFKVTLKHSPNKSASGVSAGDITNAGGTTDIDFRIT
jgi:hypothetical protein